MVRVKQLGGAQPLGGPANGWLAVACLSSNPCLGQFGPLALVATDHAQWKDMVENRAGSRCVCWKLQLKLPRPTPKPNTCVNQPDLQEQKEVYGPSSSNAVR